MTNIFTRAWDAVKSWATSSAEIQTVMVELTNAEHALLEKFHPLFNQILTTIGTQGVQIVDDALAGAMATITNGGSIGAGIAAAAETALSQIVTDSKADAKNAVYGLLAATAAALPVAAVNPAPAPIAA
jgi:hypothetical protein